MPKKAKSKTKQSPKDKFSSSIQPLPPDFASQVLELEIQVETQDSIDAFKNLVELYSHAIEFYESVGDTKYKYYQERMINFIQKQDSVLISHTHDSFHSPEKPESVPIARINDTQLFKTIDPPFELTPGPNNSDWENLDQKRVAERAMKQHELNTSMNVKEIHQNIEGQDKNLEQRISNRKKGRNRSASPRSPAKNGAFNYLNLSIVPNNDLRSIELESDRSGGLSKPFKFEIFEKELEKTMEKFILKRINDSHKIRKKYKEQIEDVRAMGNNEIIRQLVKEMETSRNKELEDLEKQIEIARMLEIQEIKEKFGNNSVN